jgi:hypothetical protein
MRWKIRKAKIDEELRTTLEQYGVAVMQQVLATGGVFIYRDATTGVLAYRTEILAWLTEQHDRQEAKEDATFAMELAIMLLVASELFFSVISYVGCTPPGK